MLGGDFAADMYRKAMVAGKWGDQMKFEPALS